MGKSRKSGSQTSSGGGKGFDFGQPLTSFVESGFEHLDHFAEAEVGGCSYGYVRSAEVGAVIPVVTLLARHEAPLRTAMSELRSWGDGVDGDAVEMTVVFMKNGGWLLGLSPEARRLAARTQTADLLLDPLYFAPTWIKTLDTTDHFLRRFEQYHEAMFAPFILSAAVWRGSPPNQRRPHDTQMDPLEQRLSLLKFQCTFSDEDSVEAGSQAAVMLATFKRDGKLRRARRSSGGEAPGRPDITRIQAKREQVLASLFTVSRRRADRTGLTAGMMEQLAPLGIQRWQVDQAIANVVLSRKMCGEDHYAPLENKSLKRAVIEGAFNHVEFADGDLSQFTIAPEILERQIDLDGRDLLRIFGHQPKRDGVAATLGELRRRRLIDA